MSAIASRQVLTSESSPLRLDVVIPENDAGGWLALTIAPGKKAAGIIGNWQRDLSVDLVRLVDLGVTELVCLLPDSELAMLQVPELPAEAERMGFTVRRLPFADGGTPDQSLDVVQSFLETLAGDFWKGEGIACFCRGGLGRGGTIAACLRLKLGLDVTAEDAIASVRRMRSPGAIETVAQERFIAAYAERLQRD